MDMSMRISKLSNATKTDVLHDANKMYILPQMMTMKHINNIIFYSLFVSSSFNEKGGEKKGAIQFSRFRDLFEIYTGFVPIILITISPM